MRNSATSWGWPSKLFHWVAALAILILLLHGWWMTHMTPRPERAANYVWHAAIGYDLLALLILRLLWRWVNPVPAMPAALKPWEVMAARAGHIGLYLLMFAAAVSGWALAGTGRRPWDLDMFGVQIPPIVTDRTLHGPLEDWHMYLSYALAALVVVHIVGALRHHLIKRNDVMRRMWFGGKATAHSADQPIAPASAKTLGS
jgi:cytochrome b561